MADDYDSSEVKSVYNSGLAQIRRLDELWIKANLIAPKGRLDEWNWILDRIWLELIGDISKKGEEVGEWKVINSKISDLKNKLKTFTLRVGDFTSEYYQILTEKEEFLRRLQNHVGKGTKFEDLDEDSIDLF